MLTNNNVFVLTKMDKLLVVMSFTNSFKEQYVLSWPGAIVIGGDGGPAFVIIFNIYLQQGCILTALDIY